MGKIAHDTKKMALDLKAAGYNAADISKRLGISQRTFECYWKKWQQELIDAGYYSQHVGIVPDDAEIGRAHV